VEIDNFIKALASHQHRRPFQQYEIELASGTVLRVNHPDALAFMGKRALVISSDGIMHQFDNEGVVQITETNVPAEKVGPAIKPTA